MLHKELENVIAEYITSNWVVIIEDENVIHFHESMQQVRNGDGEFISLIKADNEKVVYVSNNGKHRSGTVDQIRELL